MIKHITLQKIFNDSQMKQFEGKDFNHINKNLIIDFDCNIYKENGDLLLLFRKNIIKDKKIIQNALDSYKELGFKQSINRGNAAGRYRSTKKKIYRKFTQKKKKKIYEQSEISNSGIMGYMDSLNWRKPCRETQFTKNHFSKYSIGLPYIQTINKFYKSLLPNFYQKQLKHAQKSKNFIIPNTAFSTVTVNSNFRTALHKDSGDYKNGFGNLSVIEKGNYKGGYTLFPQFGYKNQKGCVGINVRTGDILFMDVHEYHCNSKLYLKNKNSIRLAFVCYLRNKMYKCNYINKLLQNQSNLSTEMKIIHMLNNNIHNSTNKFKKKIIGKGNFGHIWYEFKSPFYYIKYYNKSYTIHNLKNNKKYNNLTIAYNDFFNNQK